MPTQSLARRTIIALNLLLMLSVTACGIRVEVATPIVPSPTPRSLPDIDYSRGGVWRVQATPHIVFTGAENAQVQPFMRPDQPVLYTVQSRPLWMAVEYDVTWFDAPQSSVQIRLVVYTRSSDSDPWVAYDTAENNLTTGSVPNSNHDQISVTMYPEDVGTLKIRAEVSVVAYTEDGKISTQVNANEIEAHVLAEPGDISVDEDSLRPAVGEWDDTRLMMDWRGWQGGPCALSDQNNKEINRACDALNQGDLKETLRCLQEGLDEIDSSDQEDLKATLIGQIALLQATLGDDEAAIDSFTTAVSAQAARGDTLQVEVALHNLFSVAQMANQPSLADTTLQQLNDLRSMFDDEAGNRLTSANWGRISGEAWRLDEPLSFFQDHGLPQADIVQSWINQS